MLACAGVRPFFRVDFRTSLRYTPVIDTLWVGGVGPETLCSGLAPLKKGIHMQHLSATLTTDAGGNANATFTGLTGYIRAYQFARQSVASGTIMALATKPVETVFSISIATVPLTVTRYPSRQCSAWDGTPLPAYELIPLADDTLSVVVTSATPNKQCTIEFWID
jgi:hypothetical protein